MTYPSNLPTKLYQFIIGQSGTPTFSFGLFTSTESACPVIIYQIFEHSTLIISDYLKATTGSNSVEISCINLNCNIIEKIYDYKIKVTN